MEIQRRAYQFLFREIHAGSLALVRIAFGMAMLYQFSKIEDYIVIDLVGHSKFFLTYDFFHWVHPPSIETLKTLFSLGKLASLFVIIGLGFRLSALYVFIFWTWIFLLCRGHYTNHYYLFSLLGFWMTLSGANRWASVDQLIYRSSPKLAAKLFPGGEFRSTVPYWQVLILQLQIVVVYFFGGIAKINPDWLQGYPLLIWLPNKSEVPLLGPLFAMPIVAVVFSYFGLLIDLLAGFFLLGPWRIPRLVFVFGFLIPFHVMNHFIWGTIGAFPWFMIASTILFFDPELPRRGLDMLLGKQSKARTIESKGQVPPGKIGLRHKLITAGLGLYLLWQCLFPLRPLLIPGDASLTGEGALFSWRMMLVDRGYGAKFRVAVDGQTRGYITREAFGSYINETQFLRMCRTPKQFHRFALFLKDIMLESDPNVQPEIYAYLMVEYNGRPYQQVIDTTVNLAARPYSNFELMDWVSHGDPSLKPGTIRYPD